MDSSSSLTSLLQCVRRREKSLLVGFFVVFLALNLATGSRSPTVWTDEVAYADPAINLVESGAFTSTAWEVQRSSEHWAGNVPLYPLLLAGWIELFGMSITAVRSLNYVLVLAGTGLLWLTARRIDAMDRPVIRLLFVAVLLAGYGISDAYRSGRPDMIGFVLVGAGGFAGTLSSAGARHTLALLVGLLLPLSGLQFLPYAALLCGLAFLWAPGQIFPLSLAAGGGAILGGGGLASYYWYRGVWTDFLQSVTRHTAAGQSIDAKLLDLPSLLSADPSYTLLLLGALGLCGARARRQGRWPSLSRPAVSYPLTVAVVSPIVLFVVGKYPTYYSWMGYAPLVFGICAAASTVSWSRSEALSGVGLLLLVGGIGLPARIGVSVLQWDSRSYAPVEQVVDRHITTRDTVFSSYQGYYAAKERAGAVYLPKYLWRVSDTKAKELRAVDKMVVSPDRKEVWTNRLGGQWEQMARMQAPERAIKSIFGRPLAQPYDLVVYTQSTSSRK